MTTLKVGQKVKTTEKTLGYGNTAYHNVVGTITEIRNNTDLPILFRPDKNIPGYVGEWALFEDEVVPVLADDYWEKKYRELKRRVDAFRYDTEGM